MKIINIIIILILIFAACNEPVEEESREPIAIYLSYPDTLLLLAGSSQTITAKGVFVEINENVITNTGVLAETTYVEITSDTTLKSIEGQDLDWFTSNKNTVKAYNGTITGKAAGSAFVWAGINDILSDSVPIIVSTPVLPPELILDPPKYQLVFQDSTIVSGRTMVGQDIILTIKNDTVKVDNAGSFAEWVSLSIGINHIIAKAVNNTNGLTTVKEKYITYLPLDSSGITGHWVGETLTRPFNFDITNVAGIYVISGTLMIDISIVGDSMIIQDIVIAGLVKSDGTIDATLSKKWEGFTLQGTLDGLFLNSGSAEGSYGLTITHKDFPTISLGATWVAERQE